MTQLFDDYKDASGAPSEGFVWIKASVPIVQTDDPRHVMTTWEVMYTLDSAGHFISDPLIPSDDPGWGASGDLPYLVKIDVTGYYLSWRRIFLPDRTAPIRLSDLINMEEPPPVVPVPIPGPKGDKGDPGTGTGGGVTDHGALTGLSDPDHPIAAVQGLQAALDGKAPTVHSHALGDLPSTLATDAEVTSAISTHAATAGHELLSSTTPADLGVAAVGNGTTTARSNHVHKMPSLDDLSDVATSGATAGQALVYSAGAWAPGTVSGGGEEVAVGATLPTTEDLWVNTADVGSGYPTSEIAVYKMMWSVNVGRVSTLPAAVNVVRLAFAQGSPPTLVGYGNEGKATLVADLTAFRARGGKVILSYGGGGGTIDTTKPNEIIASYDTIKADLGGNIDGLDWDVEMGTGGMDPTGVLTVSKAIAARGGAVSFTPNGTNVNTYLPIAASCHAAGCMDSYGQQFYDAVVDWPALKNRIEGALAAGIPISKISVGMMIGPENIYWTNAEAKAFMTQAMAQFPGLQRAYLWEMSRAGTTQWVTDMNSLLPPPTTPAPVVTLKYRDPTDSLYKDFPASGLTQSEADNRYVASSGDEMTGPLYALGVRVGTSDPFGDSYSGVETDQGMSLLTGSAPGDDGVVYLINGRAGQPVQIRPGGDAAKALNVTTGGVMFNTPAMLAADPTQPLEAATKRYTDARTPKITVGTTAPSSPAVNDLWVDTN